MWISLILVTGIGLVLFFYNYQSVAGLWKGQNQHFVQLEPVIETPQIIENYDVIVIGTDPEGLAAAISAGRNGLKTLLVDGKNREILGGLITLGWLNSLDMNRGPNGEILNKGIFLEWFNQVEGDSVDVRTAANVFYNMIKAEKNIDLQFKAENITPLIKKSENGRSIVEGISFVKNGEQKTIYAKVMIDATQDADIAYLAGVEFTYGREDLGDKNSRMAVTSIFRLKNVTNDVWNQIRESIRKEDKGRGLYGSNKVSAWGYDSLQTYTPANKERTKMRGLNIGIQNDDTVLINSLQIFGIDGTDPDSYQEGMEIGKQEVAQVVDFLKNNYPEFSSVELDGVAPELYVRETRHMIGEYRLSIIDLLENRDHEDRIAFGSYPVDIQRTSPSDMGVVVMSPIQYAVPFRSLVPLNVDGLLVVGRSASFDSLAHGSARTIPVGMAAGEAAGAAAKIVIENEITFHELSNSKDMIIKLQERLNTQGMEVKPFTVKNPDYTKHQAYEGLKVALKIGSAVGGYKNDFGLDNESSPLKLVYLLNTLKRYPNLTLITGNPGSAVAEKDDTFKKGNLTQQQAAYTVACTLGMNVPMETSDSILVEKGLLNQSTLTKIANKNMLTVGDTYLILNDLIEGLGYSDKLRQ